MSLGAFITSHQIFPLLPGFTQTYQTSLQDEDFQKRKQLMSNKSIISQYQVGKKFAFRNMEVNEKDALL